METGFSKTYTVKEEHIDVQGIVDGLYYPFYMEWCRHDFIREVMGFDFEEQAHAGVYMVLSGYKINFLRSLKKTTHSPLPRTMFADEGDRPVSTSNRRSFSTTKYSRRPYSPAPVSPPKAAAPTSPRRHLESSPKTPQSSR